MALWLKQTDAKGRTHLFPYREGMKVPPGQELWDDTPPPPSPTAEPPPADHPVAEVVQYPDTVRESPMDDVAVAQDEAKVQLIRPKNHKVKGW